MPSSHHQDIPQRRENRHHSLQSARPRNRRHATLVFTGLFCRSELVALWQCVSGENGRSEVHAADQCNCDQANAGVSHRVMITARSSPEALHCPIKWTS